MDAAQLADAVTQVLAPALPALVAGGRELVADAGKAGVAAARAAIRKLWGLLKSRIDQKPAAAEAVEDVVRAPADPDALGALRLQIKKILAEDPDFAAEVERLLPPAGGGMAAQAALWGDGAIAQGPGAVAADRGAEPVAGHSAGRQLETILTSLRAVCSRRRAVCPRRRAVCSRRGAVCSRRGAVCSRRRVEGLRRGAGGRTREQPDCAAAWKACATAQRAYATAQAAHASARVGAAVKSRLTPRRGGLAPWRKGPTPRRR